MRTPASVTSLHDRFKCALTHRYFIRLHMTILISLVLLAGLLASRGLTHAGVRNTGVRYPIAVFFSYLVFFVLVRIWIALVPGALVTGGGLSNLLDRLANGGRVTDFLVLHLGPLHTGIFNIADLAIIAGAVLLGIELVKKPRSPAFSRTTFDDPRAGIARWASRRRNRNRSNP